MSTAIRFEPTMNWGHIVVVISVLGSAFGVYLVGELRFYDHEYRISSLEHSAADARALNSKITDQLQTVLLEIAGVKARLPPAPLTSRSNF